MEENHGGLVDELEQGGISDSNEEGKVDTLEQGRKSMVRSAGGGAAE